MIRVALLELVLVIIPLICIIQLKYYIIRQLQFNYQHYFQ